MLKFEQQVVGKIYEGRKDDLILTSWFHRLSIHHENSLWRFANRSKKTRVTLLFHVAGKQPSLHPSPALAWNHSIYDTENTLVYSLLSTNAVLLKDATTEKNSRCEEKNSKVRPLSAQPGDG